MDFGQHTLTAVRLKVYQPTVNQALSIQDERTRIRSGLWKAALIQRFTGDTQKHR